MGGGGHFVGKRQAVRQCANGGHYFNLRLGEGAAGFGNQQLDKSFLIGGQIVHGFLDNGPLFCGRHFSPGWLGFAGRYISGINVRLVGQPDLRQHLLVVGVHILVDSFAVPFHPGAIDILLAQF